MKRQNDGIDVLGKVPGFWFYPADFERDVQILSLEAQGLWIRMLGWMHFCERRGHLELPTGIAMTTDDIASRVGKSRREVARCIAEMERIGLFSRDDRECIFCRRMVKDSHISNVRKEAARQRLKDAGRDHDGRFAGQFDPAKLDFAPPNPPAKAEQNTVLSSSSSSSSSPKGENLCASGDAPVVDSTANESPFELSAGKPSKREREGWFDELFWPIVWAKTGRGAARKAWMVKIHTVDQRDKAIAAARVQGPGIVARGSRPGSSVLHPATWINQERYDDEPQVAINLGAVPSKSEDHLDYIRRKKSCNGGAWQ